MRASCNNEQLYLSYSSGLLPFQRLTVEKQGSYFASEKILTCLISRTFGVTDSKFGGLTPWSASKAGDTLALPS